MHRVFLSFIKIQVSSPEKQFIVILKETEIILFIHSYKPTIKRQIIMLPLDSQSTAAVKLIKVTGQKTPYIINMRLCFY